MSAAPALVPAALAAAKPEEALPAIVPDQPIAPELEGAIADEILQRSIGPAPPEAVEIGQLVAVRPPQTAARAKPQTAPQPAAAKPHELPEIYSERTPAGRQRAAASYGGSAKTEASVNAALDWLAAHQSKDGRWDASDHGAGRETFTQGQDRQGAGAKADTGLTGLALLAFLGAGHTHQTGSYTKNVARGLDYLLSMQAVDGNMAGDAEIYEYMYCHGMATLALSEALAMTGDERLVRPVRRAIEYTVAAQNLSSGGWRYKPPFSRDRGDTSQLGWQLMCLKSAEQSGIAIPERRGKAWFAISTVFRRARAADWPLIGPKNVRRIP